MRRSAGTLLPQLPPPLEVQQGAEDDLGRIPRLRP